MEGELTQKRERNPLERLLSVFAEVRGGEGLSVVLLTVNIFLLLSAYYIMKPIREALILTSPLGAELKSYMSAGITLLFLIYVPLYARIVSSVTRRTLLNSVTLFFVGCIVIFFILGQARVPLGIPFFLWIGIFNMSLVAQFWSFANDLYLPEEGKRLFAIIQFGGSAGAVVGAVLVGRLIEPIGIYPSLLIAAGVLLLSLVFTNWVDIRAKQHGTKDRVVKEKKEPEKMGREGAYRLVFNNRYLLAIAFLILLLNWVNTTGEFILGRVVENNAVTSAVEAGLPVVEDASANATAEEAATVEAAKEAHESYKENYIGKFYADFFSVVNIVGLLVQLLLVSRIIKYFGVRPALLILPIIALAGYTIAAFIPILAYLRWTKTAENATEYSLMNTLRGVLFLPTTREQKYKAKQAIDTVFVRLGDVLSAVLVFVGLNLLSFGAAHFAMVNIALVVVWIFLAIYIGKMFRAMSEEKPA